MPLLLLYHAPSFGCSSFFVYRGLCKNRSIDVRGRTQCYIIWTAATLLCVQIRTGFYDFYRMYAHLHMYIMRMYIYHDIHNTTYMRIMYVFCRGRELAGTRCFCYSETSSPSTIASKHTDSVLILCGNLSLIGLNLSRKN